MTRYIAAWIFFVGFFTLSMSAQSKVGLDGIDSAHASASLKGQSTSTCADIKATKNTPLGLATAGLALPQIDACADPIDKCNDPVKYLGTNTDCACFACEYGRSTQHNVCTRKQSDKDALLRRAK